jgi:hypothetical protein
MGFSDSPASTPASDRPTSDNIDEVRVRYTPWLIHNNDVVREYNFFSLRSDKKTIFQIGCTMEMGTFGFLHHHTYIFVSIQR